MFKRFFTTFVVAISPLLASDLPIDPAIRTGVLDNGITYYLREHRDAHAGVVEDVGASSNRAALRLVVPIGSVVEEEGEEGLAHWCEHLCFRGTRSFSERDIHEFLGAIGASIGPDANAYTGFDQTVYELAVPVDDPNHLVTAVSLMSEWASCAALEEWAVEAERRIVLEERRLHLGPQMRMAEDAIGYLLEGSRYAERMPIGLLETLNEASPETVRNFYRKWYPQVPVAFIAVGDFDIDAMEMLVVELFGALGPRMAMEEIPVFPVPHHEGTRFALVTDPETAGASIDLLFRTAMSGGIRQELIEMLGTGMFNDRYGRTCHASSLPPLAHSLEGISVSTMCDVEEVFQELAHVVANVRQIQVWGFTELEFEHARRQLLSFLTLFERSTAMLTSEGMADDCVDHFLHDAHLCHPAIYAALVRDELATLGLDEVNAFMAEIDLHSDNLVLITLPEEDCAETLMGDVMMRVAYNLSLEGEPKHFVPLTMPERLMSGPPMAAPALQRSADPLVARTTLHFDNGLTLHLIPTSNNDETFVVNGLALGGLSDFNAMQLPTARLVEPLLEEAGIGPFSAEELNHLLADKLVSLSRRIDAYTRSFFGGGVTQDAETLFQLIHLAFTKQTTTPQQFERVRNWAIATAQEGATDPEAFFQRRNMELIHSGHPYFSRSSVEELQRTDYQLADAIARVDFSNPAEFTFAIVGDFDVQAMQALAETYLGSIPSGPEPRTSYEQLQLPFPSGIPSQRVYRGQEDKAMVQLTFPISVSGTEAANIELAEAASAIIGGRVHGLMRGALNATYNVRTRLQFIEPDTSQGWLSVGFACDPQDADLLAQMAVRELRILTARGPTADEVTHLVRGHRRAIAEDLCDNNYIARELIRHTVHHWPLEGLRHIPERVDILTKQNVARQIREMVSLDNYACVILLPAALAQNSPND